MGLRRFFRGGTLNAAYQAVNVRSRVTREPTLAVENVVDAPEYRQGVSNHLGRKAVLLPVLNETQEISLGNRPKIAVAEIWGQVVLDQAGIQLLGSRFERRRIRDQPLSQLLITGQFLLGYFVPPMRPGDQGSIDALRDLLGFALVGLGCTDPLLLALTLVVRNNPPRALDLSDLRSHQ